MMIKLPDKLVARAEAYVVAHRTTVTAIIREHLIKELNCNRSASMVATTPVAGMKRMLSKYTRSRQAFPRSLAERTDGAMLANQRTF